jgi:hypothetical protein
MPNHIEIRQMVSETKLADGWTEKRSKRFPFYSLWKIFNINTHQ